MTLNHKPLAEKKLPHLAPLPSTNHPLPNPPVIIARRVDPNVALRTPTRAAGRKVSRQKLTRAELQLKRVPAEKGVVILQDERRRAFGRGQRARAKTFVEGEAGGFLEGETLLLGAERGDGTFAGGVRGRGELCHVGGGEVAVVEEGVLEDGDDGLLELDDLLLELVFGYCCGGLAVGVGWMDGRWGEEGWKEEVGGTYCRPWQIDYLVCRSLRRTGVE